jgi:hypothetical protein
MDLREDGPHDRGGERGRAAGCLTSFGKGEEGELRALALLRHYRARRHPREQQELTMTAQHDDEKPLNADAIYAAMVFMCEYAENPEGRPEVKIDTTRSSAVLSTHSGFKDVPCYEVTAELVERIYPGEAESVEYGIELARFAISDETMLTRLAVGEDPGAQAVRRFIADRAQ